ncbi:ATP-grasp domain-containing protein [Lacticaseibacillus zhaodongensis]|uniref:ATP-grasp domain-containing protein n=1 Tax=Lacticaseibacillus zhaodongensis TaxID=2668065 RepID=UPI0012D2DC9F|nr:ATP-grasp domain-containing protein [Lacticaseibacillus zhaodongensis]
MTRFIAPGATVGIIGGGIAAYQLIRAASHIGMRTVVLVPKENDIAAKAADVVVVGRADDPNKFAEFSGLAEVITYVDETVADGDMLADRLSKAQLPSGTDILEVTQDRYLEKVFLEDLNMNVLPYGQVVTADDIEKVVATVGYPSILKPIQKGIGTDQQLLLESDVDVWRAKGLLQKRPYILEAWLDKPRELAVYCVQSDSGLQVLPIVETNYELHQFTGAIVPAQVDGSVVVEILRIAETISKHLEYRGIFAIEFFLNAEGALYVKRLSPGPRPGGDIIHGVTPRSQYDLHMRAVLGWPVPTVPVKGSAVLIALSKEEQDTVATQIQIKPKWEWQFFPSGSKQLGELIVPGPLEAAFTTLEATGSFKIHPTITVDQLDNGGDKQ